MIKLASVNAFNLYGDPSEEARFAQVEEMIRAIGADIVAVQEIVASPPSEPGDPDKRTLAERHVRQLAEAVSLCCGLGGKVVVAVGGGRHHTALLWRDGLEVVPGAVRRFERDGPDGVGMWHSLVTAVFDLGGACPAFRCTASNASNETHVVRCLRPFAIPEATTSGTGTGVGSGGSGGIL